MKILKLSIFLTLWFACLLNASEESDFVIERKDLTQAVKEGDKINVVNPIGDLRARAGGGGIVEVHAVIQNLSKDTPMPVVNFERKEKELTLKIQYEKNPKGKQDRVDLVFYIPDGIPLRVETIDGEIEIKGLHADIFAISQKGPITIRSVQGGVQATNDSGTILAELMPGVTAVPQNFVTKTGDISLYLWEGMNAEVLLETSGEISTDFTLQMNFDASKEPDKIANSIIGTGGSKISGSSKRGRIRLLRLLKSLPKTQSQE